MCSFLIVFERPKNFFRIHSNMYHIDFGAGMMLLVWICEEKRNFVASMYGFGINGEGQ